MESRSARLPRWVKLVALAVVVGAFAFGVRAWRQRQERRIVALSMARAEHLVRADTWLGYREAATLLGLRAADADPAGAGSLRALALAMLALDYRDAEAATGARALVAAATGDGAEPVPERIQLAAAALAIRDGKVGTAVEALSRAGADPVRQVLAARAALLAGNPSGATDPLARALATDPRMPAALALRGDVLRRAGRTTEARDAYAAALKESSEALAVGLERSPAEAAATPHARAAFGLAKLALSRDVPAPEATAALGPLVAREDGSPPVERARAGMYLSALQGRLGDRAAATATLQALPVERNWIEATVSRLETSRERYRVPEATPPGLVSASDDDPYVPPPPPPPKVEPPPRPKLYGFKVHPARPVAKAAKPANKGPAKAKPARPKRPGAKKAPQKVKAARKEADVRRAPGAESRSR